MDKLGKYFGDFFIKYNNFHTSNDIWKIAKWHQFCLGPTVSILGHDTTSILGINIVTTVYIACTLKKGLLCFQHTKTQVQTRRILGLTSNQPKGITTSDTTAYYTKEVTPSLIKHPLNFNGGLIKLR